MMGTSAAAVSAAGGGGAVADSSSAQQAGAQAVLFRKVQGGDLEGLREWIAEVSNKDADGGAGALASMVDRSGFTLLMVASCVHS